MVENYRILSVHLLHVYYYVKTFKECHWYVTKKEKKRVCVPNYQFSDLSVSGNIVKMCIEHIFASQGFWVHSPPHRPLADIITNIRW